MSIFIKKNIPLAVQQQGNGRNWQPGSHRVGVTCQEDFSHERFELETFKIQIRILDQ